jgi:lycopene cyclase domain-containing protein
MTYPLLAGILVVLAGVAWAARVVVVSRGTDPGARGAWVRTTARRTARVMAVLVAMSAVFDNLMILAGFFTYTPEKISGVSIGVAPLEDFSYPVAAALIVSAVMAVRPSRAARE